MDSYEQIVERMTDNYRQAASIAPEETSDAGIRLRTVAAELLDCRLYLEYIKTQMFVQTAVGEYLDKHAEMYGISRHAGTKATGVVMYSLTETLTTDLVIPQGAISKTVDGREYELVERLTIAAGNTAGYGNVQAVNAGADGNVGIGEVCELGNDIMGVASVTNTSIIYNGTDCESDKQLRKRVMLAAKYPPNGANANYYKGIALSVDGVASAGIVSTGNGAISIYIGKIGGAAASDKVANVQELMNNAREVNTAVTVYSATEVPVSSSFEITASDGYDYYDVRQSCIANIKAFIDNLGVGAGVSANDIIHVLYHTDGVASFGFTATQNNISASQSCIPVLGTLTITDATV